MECEFDSDFAIPAFNKGDFRKWKRLFSIWQSITDVPKYKQGGLLLFTLENDIQDEILDFLTVDDFADENGVDKVLHYLENKYAEDKATYFYKTYESFISYRRPPNVSVSEFCREFNRRLLKVRKIGAQFPENVLAHMLLRSANISSKYCEFILATSENILYNDVMNQLKKVFPETDCKDMFAKVNNRSKVVYVCEDNNERLLRSYDTDCSLMSEIDYNIVDSHEEIKLSSREYCTEKSGSETSYESKVNCENCTFLKFDNNCPITSCDKNIVNGVNSETICSGDTSFIEKRICENAVPIIENMVKLSVEKLSFDKEQNETYIEPSNEKKINSDNEMLSLIPTNSHSYTSASETKNEFKIGTDNASMSSSAFKFSVLDVRFQQIFNMNNFHFPNFECFCQFEIWINYVHMLINFVSNFLIMTNYQLCSTSVCWSWKRRKKKKKVL